MVAFAFPKTYLSSTNLAGMSRSTFCVGIFLITLCVSAVCFHLPTESTLVLCHDKTGKATKLGTSENKGLHIFSKHAPQYSNSLQGSELSVGIVSARWNSDIVERLCEGAKKSLNSCGVTNIHHEFTPGAFELPMGAKLLAETGKFDAIICVGCLIKGETMHFECIAQASSSGIMGVQLEYATPCLFGVLTVLNKQQAIDRSTGQCNEGLSWGTSAVEMGLLKKKYLQFNK